jgi:sporulation protein YabP
MAYESGKSRYETSAAPQKTVRPHSLTLDDRHRLSVTGAEDVESFDDNEVIMHTSQGLLVIKGSGLQIDRLSTDSGDVSVQGLITSLSYEETAPSGSLWTRLFR